jgi:hypothetical protein
MQLIADLLSSRLDVGIVIALGAEQFSQELCVSTRAAADLGRVRRILVLGLKRRLLPEIVEQILGIANRGQPFDLHRLANIAATRLGLPILRLPLGRSRRGLGRRRRVTRLQFGPSNTKVRHRVERRVGVEFRRVGRRRWSSLCPGDRPHKRKRGGRAQQPRGSQP